MDDAAARREPLIGFLYDAESMDREVELVAPTLEGLSAQRLLWVDLERSQTSAIQYVSGLLGLAEKTLRELVSPIHRPRVDNFGSYYQFHVPVASSEGAEADRRLDLVIGQNWLLTVRDGELDFLKAFRGQDKAETVIGGLSAHALAASLLDWHLETYFAEASAVEMEIDHIDAAALAEPSSTALLSRMLAVRQQISALRRSLTAQRPVIYGLTRPDILAGVHEDSAPWDSLATRFERAVDTIEHLRDHLLGSFELFASRTGQETNDLVKALTFFTVIIGCVAAIAGLFGMNFDPPFFQTGSAGFIAVTGFLLAIAVGAWVIAKRRGWL